MWVSWFGLVVARFPEGDGVLKFEKRGPGWSINAPGFRPNVDRPSSQVPLVGTVRADSVEIGTARPGGWRMANTAWLANDFARRGASAGAAKNYLDSRPATVYLAHIRWLTNELGKERGQACFLQETTSS
jgi:hypothetical protein